MISKEIQKFGTSHTELGACLIEQWSSLSPAIADAVRFHHEEEELLQGGDILCYRCRGERDGPAYEPFWQAR